MKRSSDTHRNNVETSDELLEYVKRKRAEGFWGEVLVKFKDGVPYLIKEIKQIKLRSEEKGLRL